MTFCRPTATPHLLTQRQALSEPITICFSSLPFKQLNTNENKNGVLIQDSWHLNSSGHMNSFICPRWGTGLGNWLGLENSNGLWEPGYKPTGSGSYFFVILHNQEITKSWLSHFTNLFSWASSFLLLLSSGFDFFSPWQLHYNCGLCLTPDSEALFWLLKCGFENDFSLCKFSSLMQE